MRTLRAFASVLAPVMVGPVMLVPILLVVGALAACQPGDPAGYSDRYLPSQLARAAPGDLLDASPEEIALARARDRAVYQAELRRQTIEAGSLSAQQSARRGAALQRQAQTLDRARRDLAWASRGAAQAARELRTAERLDRRPVYTDRFDRADARRRLEQIEAGRALDREQRAARVAARAADRLDRLGAVESAAGRLRIMDRIERREAERAHAAAGERDELVPYLPYRRQGESVESLRERVGAARTRSAETGEPVESLLRTPAK